MGGGGGEEVAGENRRQKRLREITDAESQRGAGAKGTEALVAQLKDSPGVSAGIPSAGAPAAGPECGGSRPEPPGAERSGAPGPRRCHTPVLHQRWPLPARPRPNRTASAWSKVKNDTAGNYRSSSAGDMGSERN